MKPSVITLNKDWWKQERKPSSEPPNIKRRVKLSERYFTPQEVGKRFGFTAEFIRDEIHQGRLDAQNFGTSGKAKYRISQEALEDYLLLTNTGKKTG